AGGAVAAAAPVEEKTEFDVVLKGFDASKKIAVIKALREITGLGLVEAKNMVEGAPQTIKEALPKDAAEEMVKKLKDAGADAELK
ncbi:MAG: 50S ribosomal protein L7/L12, partial [Clostridia bacterium]|nr:50S ribosomal protein L7/L12 [Clostridia bacterium]